MKAAVFFPGIGYHCDKPLLYYSRKLAQECGYEETIALSYTYDGGNIRGNEEKMQQAFESLYEQAEKSLSAVDFDKYDEILFVAKSVGTIIASAYAEKHSIRCRRVNKSSCLCQRNDFVHCFFHDYSPRSFYKMRVTVHIRQAIWFTIHSAI